MRDKKNLPFTDLLEKGKTVPYIKAVYIQKIEGGGVSTLKIIYGIKQYNGKTWTQLNRTPGKPDFEKEWMKVRTSITRTEIDNFSSWGHRAQEKVFVAVCLPIERGPNPSQLYPKPSI